ncbi:MAG TPA: hypothetical protein VNZ53_53980 [Steroidobacteraceae bacterium]|nr:hypothetical protein [Steroidobacteraceae bacterium]
MKTPFSIFPLHRHLAAVAVSLGFLGLSAHAAPIAAPATAPGVAGAPARNTLPGAPPEEDIFDIRPPIHIAGEVFWAGWGAAALAAAGLGYGVWRLLRGKLRVKLPYEVALEKLLAARQFLSPQQARTFSDLVSEIVRSFIEQTFPVRAAHRTTEEFLYDLVANADSPLAEHRGTLGEFLGHCDLAKFAKWQLSVPQMEAMLQSARDFILATGQPVKARRPETRALGSRPAVTQA